MFIAQVSEAVWLALISALSGTVLAITGVITAYIALRAKMIELQREFKDQAERQVQQSDVQSVKMDEMAVNVAQIERQGNSMQSKLLAVTEKEALAAGEKIGKEKAEAKAQTELVDNPPKGIA